jgi:hypothetical protein
MMDAAENSDILIIPGIELQTQEEIHLLCLFETLVEAVRFYQEIYDLLPDIANEPEHFGEQFVVDPTGGFIRREDRLLLNSVRISINEAVTSVHHLNGLVIPAHVDRFTYGMLPVLGFIPDDVPFDALDFSRNAEMDSLRMKHPEILKYPHIHSADVHRVSDFIDKPQLTISRLSFNEIKRSLIV